MKNLQLILCILTIVMIGGSASAYNPLYPCECPVMQNSGPDCDPEDYLDRNCGEMDFRVFYNNSTYIIGPTDYDGDPDHIGSPPIDNRFPISTTVGLTFYNPKLDGTDYDFINWDAECTGLDKQDTYWSYEHYLSDITGPGTLTPCCPGAPGPEASWTTPSTAGLYTIDSTINDEVGGIPPWSCTYSSQMWYNDAPESREDDVVVEEHWVNDAVCSDYLTYGGQYNIEIYYEIYPDTGWMPDKIELWFIQYGGGTGEARFDVTGKGLGLQSFTWHGFTESVEEPGKEGPNLVPMGSYMVYITMEYGPYGMHTLKQSLRGGGTRMIHLVSEPLNMTMADLDEADEIYPGRFINLNNDDDNNNGIPDYLDSYVAGEDDLVALTLDASSFLPSGASVYLRETGAPGKLKIWTDPAKGVGSEVDISGNGYAILNSNLPVTFYAEGYAGSTTVDPGGMEYSYCSLAGSGNSGGVNDGITNHTREESACDIDLDVDSDNNNCTEPYGPDNSTPEDAVENDPQKPGRYIIVNNDDDDGDGIPDYFDGFNLDGSPSDDDVCLDEDDFVKMTFVEKKTPGIAKSLKVTYTPSSPDGASFTPPDQYQLASGIEGIRVWRSNGKVLRNEQTMPTGDYLAPVAYSFNKDIGLSQFIGDYYIEGIFPGVYTIKFEIEYENGEDTITCEDSVKVTVISFGIDMENSGNDLDNGENEHSYGRCDVLEEDEETIGGCIMVNWDDDDADGIMLADGTWTSPPVPDISENSVIDEDNLAELEIDLYPVPTTGIVTFSCIGADSDKIKLWKWSYKGEEFGDVNLQWNLSNPAERTAFNDCRINGIWVEGIEAGSVEKGLTITYEYTSDFLSAPLSETIKATIIMINLGNVVARDVAMGYGQTDKGHSAIVQCLDTIFDMSTIYQDEFYEVVEMQMFIGVTNNTLESITNYEDFEAYGCFRNPTMTYVDRLKILKVASVLYDMTNIEAMSYTPLSCVKPENGWNGKLDTITHLRCDGFVEVCYEINGVDSWGKDRLLFGCQYDVTYQSDIYFMIGSILDPWYYENWSDGRMDNQHEHNIGNVIFSQGHFLPSTQVGHKQPISAHTKLEKQDLCIPVGSKGGN